MQKLQKHILFKTIKHKSHQNVCPSMLRGYTKYLCVLFLNFVKKTFFFAVKHIFIYRSRT